MNKKMIKKTMMSLIYKKFFFNLTYSILVFTYKKKIKKYDASFWRHNVHTCEIIYSVLHSSLLITKIY